ncbi:hypothetical protein BH09ACT1_BH09ACT1_01860 [soil metagenome]
MGMRVTNDTSWSAPGAAPARQPEPPTPPVDPPAAPAPPQRYSAPPPPPGYPAAPPPGYSAAPPPPGYPPAPPPPPPTLAPPAYPQFGPGQQGTQQGAGAQAGWTPPPKPGLIPLRPLDLGTLLGAAFRVLRRNPRPTFGASLLIQGASTILLIVVVGLVGWVTLGRIDSSTGDDQGTIVAGSIGIIGLSSIIPIFLSIAASALLQGIIVLEVARGTLGEKLTFRQLRRLAKGRIWAIIRWSLLLVLLFAVAAAVLAAIITVFVVSLGAVGAAIGILLGLALAFGCFVAFCWLGTKLSLVPSAIMLERLTVRQAIARSWRLTKGNFWRTFGILALVTVIVQVVQSIISLPLNFISPILTTLIDPNGQNSPTALIVAGAITLLSLIVALVFSAITAVIQTATTALLYLDLRMRREGLDLDLARFVEERQARKAKGESEDGVANPYLPPDTAEAKAPAT